MTDEIATPPSSAVPSSPRQGQGGATAAPNPRGPRINDHTRQLLIIVAVGGALLLVVLFSNRHRSSAASQAVQVTPPDSAPISPALPPVLSIHTPQPTSGQAATDQSDALDQQLAIEEKQLHLLQTQAQLQQARYALQDLRIDPAAQQARQLTVPITAAAVTPAALGASSGSSSAAANVPTPTGTTSDPSKEFAAVTVTHPADSHSQAVLRAGTFLDAVLVNSLSTDNYDSPVVAMVTRPYFDPLARKLLVPAGTRLIGTAQRVQYQTASRLAITFTSWEFPNGTTFYVNPVPSALESNGVFGLMDSINRHTARILLTAGLVGLLTGFNEAQIQGNTTGAYGGSDLMRIQANQQVGNMAQVLLQPFLNAVPTITVNAGHAMKVYVYRDIPINYYQAAPNE